MYLEQAKPHGVWIMSIAPSQASLTISTAMCARCIHWWPHLVLWEHTHTRHRPQTRQAYSCRCIPVRSNGKCCDLRPFTSSHLSSLTIRFSIIDVHNCNIELESIAEADEETALGSRASTPVPSVQQKIELLNFEDQFGTRCHTIQSFTNSATPPINTPLARACPKLATESIDCLAGPNCLKEKICVVGQLKYYKKIKQHIAATVNSFPLMTTVSAHYFAELSQWYRQSLPGHMRKFSLRHNVSSWGDMQSWWVRLWSLPTIDSQMAGGCYGSLSAPIWIQDPPRLTRCLCQIWTFGAWTARCTL